MALIRTRLTAWELETFANSMCQLIAAGRMQIRFWGLPNVERSQLEAQDWEADALDNCWLQPESSCCCFDQMKSWDRGSPQEMKSWGR